MTTDKPPPPKVVIRDPIDAAIWDAILRAQSALEEARRLIESKG